MTSLAPTLTIVKKWRYHARTMMARDSRGGGSGPATWLWALPLAGGLLPAVAAITALWLSISLGLIPACNPFLDGCVSISRAARHDLPNHVFRALVLPAAVLQALTWVACAAWLRQLDARGMVRALPWLGMLAGVFMILYGTFLGTEGEAYRWMRRYGVIFYFGFTYLCMVATTGALRRSSRAGKISVPARLDRVLVALCALTLAAGVAQPFVPPLLGSEALKNQIENLLEWHVALAFTVYFVLLSWIWRSQRFSLRLTAGAGGTPGG